MSNNNIYTVLVFTAFVALLPSVIYVWIKLNELTTSWNPFG